jgi:thiamine-monophosphate kinase
MRRAAALLELSPEGVALSGGEDYELLFTCPEADAADLAEAVISQTGTAVNRVGTITKSGEPRFLDSRGREIDLAGTGWDHFGSGGQRR